MKTCKIISNAIIIFMLMASAASCGENVRPGDDNEAEEEEALFPCLNDEEDFCSCLLNSYSGVRDPEKFVPVINEFQVMLNEFLSGIPENLPDKQKIEAFEKWLNEYTCVSAHTFRLNADSPVRWSSVRFFGGDFTYIIELSWSNLMAVTVSYIHYKYENEDTEKPIEIPSVVYSLNEISCKWNLGNPTVNPELIIINSNEELENHITCTDGDDYSAIDFTKQMLLLVYGQEAHYDRLAAVYLHRFSTGYLLNVDFIPSPSPAVRQWNSAIVVDKLDEEIDIEIS